MFGASMAITHQEFLKAHKSSNDTIFLALQLKAITLFK